MIIAQITDFHVAGNGQTHGGVDTTKALAAAVEHLNALHRRPDLVLATGDLAAAGTPEDYAAIRPMLDRLAMPVYLIPGNHDDRENLRNAFTDHAYLPAEGAFLHYTVDTDDLRLIGLDTLVPGADGGALCAARLDWLAARLAEGRDEPTLIFMHHPPFVAGIPNFDAIRCAGAEALGMILRQNPQVQAVVCGHIHRPIHHPWQGTVVITAPSTGYQYPLEMRPDQPFRAVPEPPGAMIYLWSRETGLVSHLSYIGAGA